MENKIKLLTLSIALAASSASAANYAIEARGDAMGGVGVVSATFLTAPFYNPALTAIYRRNDDYGMITPSFGLSYSDEHMMVDDLKKAADLIEQGTSNPADLNAADLDATLKALDGDIAKLEIGGVVAFAIPNKFIAANVFGKAYAESYANPIIASDSTNPNNDLRILENAQNSTVNAVSVGVTEVGISLAKYQTFLGQHISFGITPKLQRIYTYVYEASFTNYDIKDVRDNGTGETMFNMDAGFLWFYGPLRVGFSATNLVSRDIKTLTIPSSVSGKPDVSYAYQMRPLYTVGVGLVADYATISVDYDLNEEERYTNFNDNTQMLRVGGEIDIMRQLKLRAGWNRNLAYDNLDDTVTAGIGLSPLNLFQLDIGASYTNENSMGAYINFLTSY
ncbi:conjugal transfer protein TraF [Vibrio europaeus]|uniref:Conjugal transfer protein TraF n=1 Tax=Vibrio europaeus TaxID=300876 RepID=A0A178J9V8_9VIBR|nr:conjugal transfer protein TraF [Vibrio europaeus]MDC5704913.1 conjugal transfer protein TraF [Vibrio europaeus]MDC5710192.1 conjugal transfer protein TraF [Vibrio europaeus]MDC5715282.1 conjugal transfer protein TraF [Vibrio europaeus]MDC5724669.1 conjugal transfer protein TraF [Vibrio europaeus]MDC5728634.1 conjugal transfer protein TraF [Vibrio europaeus]